MPKYLSTNRHGTYYFRIVIPAHLRTFFSNQREIRRSLSTDSKREAIVKAKLLWADYFRLFHENDVEELMSRRKKTVKKESEYTTRLMTGFDAFGDAFSVDYPDDPEREAKEYKSLLDEKKQTLLANPSLLSMRNSNESKPQEDSKSGISIKFTHLVESFFKERKRENVITQNTIDDYQSVYTLFIKIMGDIDSTLINHSVANRFKQVLCDWPKNSNKGRLAGLSVEELVSFAQNNPDQRISVSNINKYITRMCTLLDWSVRHGYTPNNPFERIRLKKSAMNKNERKHYTEEQLDKVFSIRMFKEHEYKEPHEYWLPLIALHTGMRLEEMCQLYAGEIVIFRGVRCFRVRDSEVDQKVKSENAIRTVPIHPKLFKLGFDEYLKSFAPGERIFPALTANARGKYGGSVSKKFGRIKKNELGFGKEMVFFHSFRHTVTTRFAVMRVDDKSIKTIVGHVPDDKDKGQDTTDGYIHDFSMAAITEAIYSLDFESSLINVKPYSPDCIIKRSPKPEVKKKMGYAERRLLELQGTQ